jgi:hypothetical protein
MLVSVASELIMSWFGIWKFHADRDATVLAHDRTERGGQTGVIVRVAGILERREPTAFCLSL